MLSHSTADTSCSCWILSFHSPSETRDMERRASAEGSHCPAASLLLRTPSMHRDHTALLNKAGP